MNQDTQITATSANPESTTKRVRFIPLDFTEEIARTGTRLPTKVASIKFDSLLVSLPIVLKPIFEHYYIKYIKLKISLKNILSSLNKPEDLGNTILSILFLTNCFDNFFELTDVWLMSRIIGFILENSNKSLCNIPKLASLILLH